MIINTKNIKGIGTDHQKAVDEFRKKVSSDVETPEQFNPDPHEPEPHEKDEIQFCPYCGKKIR